MGWAPWRHGHLEARWSGSQATGHEVMSLAQQQRRLKPAEGMATQALASPDTLQTWRAASKAGKYASNASLGLAQIDAKPNLEATASNKTCEEI